MALAAGGALSVVGLTAKPGDAPVAIVFGSKVETTGEPSERLKARLDTATELYESGRAEVIVVSGGLGDEGFSEPRVMKDYLVDAGVPVGSIHEDDDGLNTGATCANAKAFMESAGQTSANIVTQYFHIPRAVLACRRAGIDVDGAEAPRFFELRDLYSIARELVALPVYLISEWG